MQMLGLKFSWRNKHNMKSMLQTAPAAGYSSFDIPEVANCSISCNSVWRHSTSSHSCQSHTEYTVMQDVVPTDCWVKCCSEQSCSHRHNKGICLGHACFLWHALSRCGQEVGCCAMWYYCTGSKHLCWGSGHQGWSLPCELNTLDRSSAPLCWEQRCLMGFDTGAPRGGIHKRALVILKHEHL